MLKTKVSNIFLRNNSHVELFLIVFMTSRTDWLIISHIKQNKR